MNKTSARKIICISRDSSHPILYSGSRAAATDRPTEPGLKSYSLPAIRHNISGIGAPKDISMLPWHLPSKSSPSHLVPATKYNHECAPGSISAPPFAVVMMRKLEPHSQSLDPVCLPFRSTVPLTPAQKTNRLGINAADDKKKAIPNPGALNNGTGTSTSYQVGRLGHLPRGCGSY